MSERAIITKIDKYQFEYDKTNEEIFVYDISKEDKITGEYWVAGLYDPTIPVNIFVTNNNKGFDNTDEYDSFEEWKEAIEKKLKMKINWNEITGNQLR